MAFCFVLRVINYLMRCEFEKKNIIKLVNRAGVAACKVPSLPFGDPGLYCEVGGTT